MATRTINPLLKLGLEIGPIAVFFLCFQFGARLIAWEPLHNLLVPLAGETALAGKAGPMFVATAAFMVAIALSLGLSWTLTRSLPRMAVVTALVVAIFGGLTFALRDETFIKMKPTVVNGLFALILGYGLLQGRSYLKYLMGETLPLTDEGWMIFTRRWCLFFVFLACLNEVIWRTQSDAFWVSFKTFGNLPITLAFMVSQWPMLQRHMIEDEPGDGGGPGHA